MFHDEAAWMPLLSRGHSGQPEREGRDDDSSSPPRPPRRHRHTDTSGSSSSHQSDSDHGEGCDPSCHFSVSTSLGFLDHPSSTKGDDGGYLQALAIVLASEREDEKRRKKEEEASVDLAMQLMREEKLREELNIDLDRMALPSGGSDSVVSHQGSEADFSQMEKRPLPKMPPSYIRQREKLS